MIMPSARHTGMDFERAGEGFERAFFLPLALAVGFSLAFLLIGFFIASAFSDPMFGNLIAGSTEGLGEGNRIWKGTGGPSLVSFTTGLSTWIGSVASKPFQAMKALQLSPCKIK